MTNSQPQMNSYLWAIGSIVSQFSASELVKERYQVFAPHIWQDTKPEQLPFIPEELPEVIIP
ncbi:MAG: hypothetical protein F6K10_25760, partial [Moorea sp. SIO2B7]|nr:hypothetical protein [Moorena sp. SIO2B7]